MEVKLPKFVWLTLWGCLWIFAGFMLLRKGVYFLFVREEGLTDPKWGFALIGLAIIIGFFKGRILLKKAAKRIIEKISIIQGSVSYKQALERRSLLMMAVMIGLGLTLNRLPILPWVRGLIDLTIGTALLQGSVFFFQGIFTKQRSDLV